MTFHQLDRKLWGQQEGEPAVEVIGTPGGGGMIRRGHTSIVLSPTEMMNLGYSLSRIGEARKELIND